MSYVKTALKNAKEALKAKNWEGAIKECEKVLQYETDNYTAYVYWFLSEKKIRLFMIRLGLNLYSILLETCFLA
jgi:hypothetical protein